MTVRTIACVYERHEVPPNVQRHMLRVAAVAERIGQRWYGPPFNRERVLSVLLVHDLGNIVKCDYENLPHMLEEEEPRAAHWSEVQARFRARFGADDHLATRALAAESGLGAEALALLDRMAFEHNDATLAGDDFEVKIAAYADQRVGPRGIVSLAERFTELKARYTGASGALLHGARGASLMECAHRIEEQLFARCRLAPADIDDAAVAPIVEALRDFELR